MHIFRRILDGRKFSYENGGVSAARRFLRLCAGLLRFVRRWIWVRVRTHLKRRNNYFYQRRFVLGLNARYARKVELFPERYSRNGFAPIRTVREFDDAITAPQFGYRDAQEYYEAAGAKCVIDKVRVPLLLITAKDDPFVPFEAIRTSGAEEKSRDRDRCSETWRALRVLFRMKTAAADSGRNSAWWNFVPGWYDVGPAQIDEAERFLVATLLGMTADQNDGWTLAQWFFE